MSQPWSLERRQWLGLALLTFIGLSLVSVTVYLLTAHHLAERRQEALRNLSGLVLHLLHEEPHTDHNLARRLDDHFSGHADIALNIDDSNGVLYRTRHQISAGQAATLDFQLPNDLPEWGGANARLSQDTRGDQQLLNHLALTLGLSALLGAVIFAFGGRFLIHHGLRPVQHLLVQIRALNASNLGQRLDGSRQPAELQALVTQINALLERIENAYRQLEGFNADVAHELNTPLATLITSTEVALRRPRDLPSLQDLLGSNLEELHRLSAIVQDMLFLAGVDRGALARRQPTPSVRAQVQSVADYHEAALAEKSLSLDIQGEQSGAFDLPLLKRALSNILSNACRYAKPGTRIQIEIQPEPQSLRLTVINQGPAIAAEHLPQIFDRLFRADPARTGTDHHHGLGLAIVAAVARMHGGQAFASSTPTETRVGILLDLSESYRP